MPAPVITPAPPPAPAVRVGRVARLPRLDRLARIACVAGLGCAGSASALAVERPLWELGIGTLAGSFESWPASSQRTNLALVYPWFVYRGDVLRLQDGALTARVVDLERLVLDLSVNAAPAARVRDGSVREGMPDLGWLFEAGPRLRWRLDDPADVDERWFASIAVRGAISIDSGLDRRGFVASPSLDYLNRKLMGARLTVGASLAPEFATSRYTGYYYGVAPEFATAARPSYAAPGGYLGTRLYASAQYRVNRTFTVFGFVDARLYSGAAAQDSPLHERSRGLAGGIGLAATLTRSSETVRVRD